MNYKASTILAAVACAATLFSTTTARAADEATAQKPKDPIMQIDDLLSKSGAFFLSTADGDQPKPSPSTAPTSRAASARRSPTTGIRTGCSARPTS